MSALFRKVLEQAGDTVFSVRRKDLLHDGQDFGDGVRRCGRPSRPRQDGEVVVVVPNGKDLSYADAQSVANALDGMGFGYARGSHLHPVQPRGGDVDRLEKLVLQLGQESPGRPAGPARYEFYAAAADRLDDVIDLLRCLRPSSNSGPKTRSRR